MAYARVAMEREVPGKLLINAAQASSVAPVVITSSTSKMERWLISDAWERENCPLTLAHLSSLDLWVWVMVAFCLVIAVVSKGTPVISEMPSAISAAWL